MAGLLDLPAGMLSLSQFAGVTGRGVRVAVIDSGVHSGHPHVGVIEGGVAFAADGTRAGDPVDRLGHGTAVTAAIREKAPDAELLPVKVFDRELRATADALVAAIEWAVAERVHLINLSLGTANQAHEARLLAAVSRAAAAGVGVVAAAEQDGVRWLPGSLVPAIGVTMDWHCPREQSIVMVDESPGARRLTVSASPYPRPIPGVPPERNLKGVSFAVANATGLICLHLSLGLSR